MKLLLVVALAVACTARPDIGLTYKTYGSYGSPSRTYIPQGGNLEQHNYEVSSSNHGNIYGPNHVNYYQSGNNGFNNHFQHNTFRHEDSSRNVYTTGQKEFNNHYDSINYQSHHSNQAQVRYETIQGGPVEVTKHAYFYDAPDDGIVSQTRVHVAPAASKKNVNLVFVKTPNYAHNTQVITPSQQHQEKTHIYVLVKKPEEGQDIHVPSIAPAAPSKPEVFFVKYNTQKEAEDKIQATLQGAHGAAHHASELGSEGAFVSSISRSANLRNNVGVTVQRVATGSETYRESNVVNTDVVSNHPVATGVVPSFTEVVNSHVVNNHPGYTYKK